MVLHRPVEPAGITGMWLEACPNQLLVAGRFPCPSNLPSGIVGTINCVSEDGCTSPDYIFGPSVSPLLLFKFLCLVFGEAAMLVFQAAAARAQ
jgi:hypothetical protein